MRQMVVTFSPPTIPVMACPGSVDATIARNTRILCDLGSFERDAIVSFFIVSLANLLTCK